MREIIVSTVGRLMGDTWMMLPTIVKLSQLTKVSVVAGSYAHDAVLFVRNHVVGANFAIVDVVEDPDESTHPFCPGIGGPSITAARCFLEGKYPNAAILAEELLTGYSIPFDVLETREDWVREENYVVVQPYTCHDWKNCDDILAKIAWTVPSYLLGLKKEVAKKADGQVDARGFSFDAQVKLMLGAKLVVSVLSSWSAAATVFGKKQFVASFTSDVAAIRRNKKAQHLVKPTAEQIVALLRGHGVC